MQNANLSQEISRLYEELSDHILARDGEGASRIYQELLRAGQSSEMLAARVTAIQNTPELELFRQANEQGSRSPDGPPQGSAEPAFAGGSIIERAVQRLDWIAAHNAPPGLEGTKDRQSQTDPARVARVLRLRFGSAGPTPLPLIFRCLFVSVLTVAAAGSGIFLLRHSAEENATAESARATEASATAAQNTSSIGNLAMTPLAAGALQKAAPAGVAPTPAPTVPASESQLALGITPSVPPPGGPAPTAARTPSNEPEAAMTLAAPTSEAMSQKPPINPAFSRAEIAALVSRGDWLFATGDVDSARLLYQRAADAGEARAAVRLGETFDPIFLNKAHLREARADSGMAMFWYRRARDLGAIGVASRLKSLEAKPP